MRPLLPMLFSLLVPALTQAQLHKVKPVKPPEKDTRLAIGVGMAKSVLYLTRNVKEDNDAVGLHTSVVYLCRNQFRYSLEYTFYRPIDIAPTWYGISAHAIEANLNLVFRVPESDGMFYPQFGVSYNMFSGFYTGTSDYLHLSHIYKANEWASTRWFGLNIGTGYEHKFGNFSAFVDYKMRIGFTEGRQLNIVDVCINGGLRYHIRVKPLAKWFKGTRSRYTLHKKRPE